MDTDQQHSILLIGPLPNLKAGKLGGARISFHYLVSYFERNAIPFDYINTQPYGQSYLKWLNLLLLFGRYSFKIWKADIVFVNMSMGGTRFIAPLLFWWTKRLGKTFIFRPFGSRLKDEYKKYSHFQKWVFHQTLLHSDILFLQTLELCDFFQQQGGKVAHLPTSRDEPATQLLKNPANFQKKFIFLGHIKRSKGIDLILEAANQLGEAYTFHLYGPIKEAKYSDLFRQDDTIYKGLLRKEEVRSKLKEYDVLLLPTWFEGEGYPGAIVEAFSIGLPVITTQWKAIPEIVTDGDNGLLIPPKSVPALIDAILSFDESNYSFFSKRARATFVANHDADKVLQQVLKQIEHVQK